jgi:hypothetical protein
MAHSISSPFEIRKHVLVIALELADAWEPPSPIALWIGGVSQLPGWAKADGDFS